ncbi:MAG TPA: 2-phosphosulfolactate phosphatase, partial [bacterium]|nr:2-phosphosulfolactate phosphatase [bacterium]
DPKDVKPTVIQNATVVLADVLRATTTIPVFLYHGAAGVALCPDPGTAKKVFEKQKRGEGLLAGERDLEKIPGFHLGGSPNDSSREKVKDRVVAYSVQTPLKVFKNAKYLVLGSFVNLGEVYDSCLRGKRDVVIVSAGGPEDSAFAGMLVDFLQSTLGETPIVLAESAKDAIALYKPWQGRILDLLKESPEGKELIQKGFAKDLDFAAKVSRISAVPYLKDDMFLREEPPKRRFPEEAKKTVPQKGKSIKVNVPLFPKNPEHPVPGMEKAGKKGAEKKGADKKGEDKKHEDKKGEKGAPAPKKGDAKAMPAPAKKGEAKAPAAPKVKKPPKPLFSKKTVATAPVKMIKKER